MKVVEPIYYQFFYTANSVGDQPIPSQYLEPLAPQSLALGEATIPCVLLGCQLLKLN